MTLKPIETRYETEDSRLLPAYSVAEASHYLHMPEGTLRSWVVGRWYPVAGQAKRSKPLIQLDDPKDSIALSFDATYDDLMRNLILESTKSTRYLLRLTGESQLHVLG